MGSPPQSEPGLVELKKIVGPTPRSAKLKLSRCFASHSSPNLILLINQAGVRVGMSSTFTDGESPEASYMSQSPSQSKPVLVLSSKTHSMHTSSTCGGGLSAGQRERCY